MTVERIKTAEQATIATLKACAAALDAVGTTELASALSTLKASAEAAQKRLEAAAAEARAILSALTEKAEAVAPALSADLMGTPKPAEKKRPAAAAPIAVKQEGSATPAGEPQTAPEPSERVEAVRNALDAIDAPADAPEVAVVAGSAADGMTQAQKEEASATQEREQAAPSPNGAARRGRKTRQ